MHEVNLTISNHKLETISSDTKFTQGSTSDKKVVVKISDKNSKAYIQEKYSNLIMFK